MAGSLPTLGKQDLLPKRRLRAPHPHPTPTAAAATTTITHTHTHTHSQPPPQPGLTVPQKLLFFEAAAHHYLAFSTIFMAVVPIVFLYSEVSPMVW